MVGVDKKIWCGQNRAFLRGLGTGVSSNGKRCKDGLCPMLLWAFNIRIHEDSDRLSPWMIYNMNYTNIR